MRTLSATLVAVTLGCGSGATPQTAFDGARALSYVEAQLEFGPRVPNTEGHKRMGNWLLDRLRERADSVEVQGFTHVTVDGDTLALRNFIARFRPRERERVLYVAHWDTRPHADNSANLGEQRLPVPGANDGASGVAVLLGVADVFREKPPAFGVDLLFVDGEDYGDFGVDKDVLLGSRYYASTIDTTALPLFAVVWDMVGDRDLEILREGHSVDRAPEVVERVWRIADELGYGRVFRRNVSYVTDDHLPLLDAGIRAINVIDLEYGPSRSYWHTLE
ncbi:MAG: M28 family peptidase, partial [Gemmatimonadales bacterium]